MSYFREFLHGVFPHLVKRRKSVKVRVGLGGHDSDQDDERLGGGCSRCG